MIPRALPLALVTLALATVPGASGQFAFVDQTTLLSNSGLGTGRCSSGVAIGVVDMDGDGRDDIIRLHNGTVLSIEYQRTPGTPFEHGLIGDAGISPWAICVADIDRDGGNDLVLAPFNEGIRLYRKHPTSPGYSVSLLQDSYIDCQGTFFADLNRDGHIDLFSCHDTADNVKWENIGGGELRTTPELIDTDLGDGSAGNYAALWADFDQDGLNDLYLSKCSAGVDDPQSPERINRLFKAGASGFSDVAPGLGLADGAQTWCADFADIDNDGDLDLFVLNHPEDGSPSPSRLLENVGGNYIDITASSGLAPWLEIFGIQALFRDFDNDGLVDLLVSSSDLLGATPVYRLFHNRGDKTFVPQPGAFVEGGTTGGAGTPLDFIHSFAVGDLNQDGFLDIYAARASGYNDPTTAPDRLFMNAGNANHFLTLRLRGTVSNPNAIGAQVKIFGPWGSQTRGVRSGEGYGIMNSLDVHFGLGGAKRADRVVITWPSGFTTELLDVPSNQILEVTEIVAPSDFVSPVITSAATTSTRTDSNFTYRIRALNNPIDFSLTGAPPGMSVDRAGTVRWRPRTAGTFSFDISASNPAGSDTRSVEVTVTRNPLPPAIEAEGLVVSTSADHPWSSLSTVTHDGVDAAHSADIGDGQTSWMEVEVEGPGTASFWWRVSSEDEFDFLIFQIDGEESDSMSGLSGWQQKSLDIPAGSHRLRWSYQKDGSVSENQDRAWVDEFAFVADDTDGDGMRDGWEIANFGDLSQGSGDDFDGDGQDNGAEEASGTDPTDPNSALRISRVRQLEDGMVAIRWDSQPGIIYGTQSSGDLRRWTDFGADHTGTGAPLEVVLPTIDGVAVHWRVVVLR